MSKQGYHELAHWFFVLSHPARLQILDELLEEDKCVCDLQAALNKSQPYVSQQLCVLRESGIVACRRDGQYVYYRLVDPLVEQLLEEIVDHEI